MAKNGKKRVYRSVLGIPLYIIAGAAFFVLFSAVYDWIVLDRSAVRYGLLISSIIILVTVVALHLIPLESLKRIASRQMGGN